MFSGIVEGKGRIRRAGGGKIEVAAGAIARGVKKGASVAVNGACLTVVKNASGTLSFDVVPETLARTGLGSLKPGDAVNLERPLKFGGRIEGHFVLGHVDGRGAVERVVKAGNNGRDLFISYPRALRKFMFEKGSVAIHGVSLTIGRVTPRGFWVHLVPHTLGSTVLGALEKGDEVNLEADILAKMASRL